MAADKLSTLIKVITGAYAPVRDVHFSIAGNETIIVSTEDKNYPIEILSCLFLLTTDATAANRYVYFRWRRKGEDSSTYYLQAVGQTTASTQKYISGKQEQDTELVANGTMQFTIAQIGLPPRLLLGHKDELEIEIINGVAGDTLEGNIRYKEHYIRDGIYDRT